MTTQMTQVFTDSTTGDSNDNNGFGIGVYKLELYVSVYPDGH